jgi:hypothetical protein
MASHFDNCIKNMVSPHSYGDPRLSIILLLCRDIKDMKPSHKERLKKIFDEIYEMKLKISTLGNEVLQIADDYGMI